MPSVLHDLWQNFRLARRQADDPFAPFVQMRPAQFYARWMFLRVLGVGFTAAFISLSTQIHGLIGPRGILPAGEYIAYVRAAAPGVRGFLFAPSLLWLDSSHAALTTICAFGFVAGLALTFNVWPRPALFFCWLFYLSFVSVAQNFSGFQSEGLLLESALLGMYLAPRGIRPGLGERSPPSPIIVFLLRFFAFRLVVEAGIAKLGSTDPSWRELRAMDEYYENCPFPTWVGWFVQQLPRSFHTLSTGFTLIVESAGAVALLVRGWPRRIAAAAWISMHLSIALTGNYTFLNYNSIALGLLFFDDQEVRAVLSRLREPVLRRKRAPPRVVRVMVAMPLALSTYGSTLMFLGYVGLPWEHFPRALVHPVLVAREFGVANRFALFAGMTWDRDHIEYEGSNDGGRTWRTYRFRWQPQALDVKPRFMAPHLPRFDWNLWFAVNGSYDEYPFVIRAGARLMEGEPTVIHLFAHNPFPDRPPDLMRFPLYRYHMTNLGELRSTGNWWKRERLGYYAPPLYRDAHGKIQLSPDAKKEPDESEATE